MATAGVGIGPNRSTSMPTEVKPATRAGLDHVAGEPRVLADHDAMAMIAAAKGEAGRLTDLERQFRRDRAIGATANAVGAEVLADHMTLAADLPATARCRRHISAVRPSFSSKNIRQLTAAHNPSFTIRTQRRGGLGRSWSCALGRWIDDRIAQPGTAPQGPGRAPDRAVSCDQPVPKALGLLPKPALESSRGSDRPYLSIMKIAPVPGHWSC